MFVTPTSGSRVGVEVGVSVWLMVVSFRSARSTVDRAASAMGSETGTRSASAASSRRRSDAANSGRGGTGPEGRRSASNGSGIVVAPFVVGASERGPGPDEQGLGGVQGATELL